MSTLWTFDGGSPRQLGAAEAVAIPTPSHGTLQGQAGQLLPLLDSLDPNRQWLADAGLYVEHRAGVDAGYGWRVPEIGTDASGRPAAVRTPQAAPTDTRSAEEIAAELRAGVDAVAQQAQIAAASGYAWPESADWHGLEQDSRDYIRTQADQTPIIGRSLRADTGSDDPAALLAGAERVVAKADAFRAARGAIVQRRRALHASIDAFEAADDRDSLLSLDIAAGWPA